MADYTAREWSNGDIVTAVNLNQIENGIEEAGGSGGIFICTASVDENDNVVLDKTFGEIKEAFLSGLNIWLYSSEDDAYNLLTLINFGNRIIMCPPPMVITLYASSDNDYPSTTSPDSGHQQE